MVVNDVAAVNIDAQLIQKYADPRRSHTCCLHTFGVNRYERSGTIEIAELANGCAKSLVREPLDLACRGNGMAWQLVNPS